MHKIKKNNKCGKQKTLPAPQIIRAAEIKQPQTLWKLTEIDKASFQWVLRGTWIFRGKPDAERIKAALAELLGYYPHLSGRMERGTVIHLNNTGVPFTLTGMPGLSVQDVCQPGAPLDGYSGALPIARVKEGKDAPLSIMLTELADGYILGVSASHACLDGNSFYTLVSNWGRLCRGESIEPPVPDQTLHPVPGSLSRTAAQAAAARQGWKKISRFGLMRVLHMLLPGRALERTSAFHFSAAALGALKKSISDKAGCRCSTNDVLSAFLTGMHIRLFRHSSTARCTQVTVIDERCRLPQIPPAFAGNASFTVVSAEVNANAAPFEISRMIHRRLAPFLEKPSAALQQLVLLSLELIHHRIPIFPFNFVTMHTKKPTTIYINNFSKLPIYEVDFGKGKPVKVVPHNLGDPVIIWPAPPAQGGVEVYFTGVAAHAIYKLTADDPWLKEMRQFSGN